MSEYIEREAALDICQKEYEDRLRMSDYCGDTVAWNIGGAIKSMPAADVVEVRHAKWKHFHKQNKAVCTSCSFERDLDADFGRAIACPNCGAKMN